MILYFYIVVFLYSVSKHIESYYTVKFKFLIVQLFFFVIGFLFSLFLDNQHFNIFIKSSLLSFLLLISDFVSRLIGMPQKNDKNIAKNFINYIGLIDGINISLISITFFFSYYIGNSILLQIDFSDKDINVIAMYIDNLKYGLTTVKDTLFFFGALIGVIMAILFANTKWPLKRKNDFKIHYINNHSAFRLIYGYIIVAISSFIWIIRPLSLKVFEMLDLL